MPKTPCHTCDSLYQWDWEDAFDKFGLCEFDGLEMTDVVIEVLEDAGYDVGHERCGNYGTIISSIRKNDIELIPLDAIRIGHDDPRQYLPPDVIALLDDRLSADAEVAS